MPETAYVRTFSQTVALAVICLSPVALHAAAPDSIPEFDATYAVRYGILRGTMTLQLSRRNTGYLYETSLSPRGMASMTSFICARCTASHKTSSP